MEKQIEEMAITTCPLYRAYQEKRCGGNCECDFNCHHYNRCEKLYEKGYRRASDVAEEIFEEIEVNLHNLARLYLTCDLTENFGICDSIYEEAILPVKKKYTDMITKESNNDNDGN